MFRPFNAPFPAYCLLIMETFPYSHFRREDMILRDHLALDRTVLANERTFLAHIRTSLTFLAAGLALIKLFPLSVGSRVFGWIMIAAGILVMAIGVRRVRQFNRKLAKFRLEQELLNEACRAKLAETTGESGSS